MNLKKAVDGFYYRLAMGELRRLSKHSPLPNITYNSLLYLDLIDMTPECTASKLAELLHISKPGVTAKVGELIRQGLVEKTQSATDKRVYYLTLRPSAMEEFHALDTMLDQASRYIEAKYSSEELQLFSTILADLGQAFENEGNHA